MCKACDHLLIADARAWAKAQQSGSTPTGSRKYIYSVCLSDNAVQTLAQWNGSTAIDALVQATLDQAIADLAARMAEAQLVQDSQQA